ncbi:acyl carrier protein [Streptomyces sp. VRA16 Mangrove soil]|uniref:acyl carrier protein n=1 Tax=Streptomyces sp. VRA16 Mangrove soil TaxID=2817434 RepID=UPI001A9CCB6F|nr:phosphopantetheine-binding protein [Streptomyces sp. VRA16 Mangrove soil]MBO1332639.1 acyl carrier protein [Streptomyces sp. VRA16 Mangrove soil]
MSAFTLDEFRTLVDDTLDSEAAAALDETSLDTTFTDLGYDSLTVFELVTRIQDDFPVTISDEQLDELKTPAALIAYVAARLTEARA